MNQLNLKVSCLECGLPILMATAERNDGLCVPCKKGTRLQIEESKRKLQEERQRPREPNYWLPLVKQEAERGFESFDAVQRTYFCVCLLDGEVYNGGFDQFFTNSSGDYYNETEASLGALEFYECIDLLRQAKRLVFGEVEVPRDRSERFRITNIALQNPTIDRLLDELSSLFVEAFKRTGDRTEEFARCNNLEFVLK